MRCSRTLWLHLKWGSLSILLVLFFFFGKRGMHSRVQKSLKLRDRLLEGWPVLAIVNKYRNLYRFCGSNQGLALTRHTVDQSPHKARKSRVNARERKKCICREVSYRAKGMLHQIFDLLSCVIPQPHRDL